jgi:actin-related protein 6
VAFYLVRAFPSALLSALAHARTLLNPAGPAFNAYHDIQAILQHREPNPAAQLPADVMLLVDSGYSHTTITPVVHGRPLQTAIRRLDLGGKLLTNYLTRLLSVRHFDMRNDTYIVNEMKEGACFVSLDFKRDLETTWKGTRGEARESYATGGGIAKNYVLPDFHSRFHGMVQEFEPSSSSRPRKLAGGVSTDDIVTLRNERFAVPELLFNPVDIGLQQPGIPDLVMQVLSDLPIGLWPGLLANVVVVGGNALFDNFVERLRKEIQERVPDDCLVRVARPEDPVTNTWLGAAHFSRHVHADRLAVTKQEYEEHGAGHVARKFAVGLGIDDS